MVFGGGLKIKTTIDTDLQRAAEQAIAGRLGGYGPSASLVAIKNSTGEVKAMVGGASYKENAFNLATNGHRQPGSAFKPFTLIRALADGVSPETTYTSQKRTFDLKSGPVHGERLTTTTTGSSRCARPPPPRTTGVRGAGPEGRDPPDRADGPSMGVRTKVSTNPAMTLGGLAEGVTPLEMAYAYSTIANKGERRSGKLAPGARGRWASSG